MTPFVSNYAASDHYHRKSIFYLPVTPFGSGTQRKDSKSSNLSIKNSCMVWTTITDKSREIWRRLNMGKV